MGESKVTNDGPRQSPPLRLGWVSQNDTHILCKGPVSGLRFSFCIYQYSR